MEQKFPRHGGYFDPASLKSRLEKLRAEQVKKDFWKDQAHARSVGEECARIEEELADWKELENCVPELLDLLSISEAGEDSKTLREYEKEFKTVYKNSREIYLFIKN